MIRTNKLVSGVVALTMLLSLVGGVSASAQGMSLADLVNLFIGLGIISADKADAARTAAGITGTTPAGTTSGYNFAKDLTVGSRGADVTALQNAVGVSPATGYFGAITKAAVIQYQLAKGIAPAAGYVGAKTRAVLNNAGPVVVNPGTVTPTGTDLKVSLAATSPASGAIIATQAAANLAEFTFTNTSASAAVVTNVTLAKTGVAGDSTLDAVYLYDGATRLTDSATVSSGKITFNAGVGLFTVPAGASKTISVRSNIASVNNQLIGVSLTGVTSNVPVSAVYPIAGAMMSVYSVASGEIASTTIAAGTDARPTATTTYVQAGTMNYSIWTAPLNISNKAVRLSRAAFKVVGSIPMDSLENIKLYVGGVQVATSVGADASGYITFDLSSNPYKIETGSRNLEVRADITKGSNRDFTVSIQNAADIGLIDTNYNIGVTPILGVVTTGKISVSVGTVSVQDDSTLIAGDVVSGANNVLLGKWNFKAYGDDMKISQLDVTVATTSGTLSTIDGVSLFANGSQIGSTQTITIGSYKTLSLGSSLIINAGQSVSLELRADLKNSTGNVATGTAIRGYIKGIASNTQGAYSSNISAVPGTLNSPSEKYGPEMTVVGANVSVSPNILYTNTTVLPNTSKVKIGSFIVKNLSTSEEANISGLTVTLGGSIATTDLGNLYVDISGVGSSNPVNVQSPINVTLPSGNFSVAANSSRTIDVYADIDNVSGGSTTTVSLAIVGNGTNSNVSISDTADGQTISVNSGTLAAISLSATSQSERFVLGNTTANPAGVFTLKAVSAPVKIKKVGFMLSSSTSTAVTSITFNGKTENVTVAGATTTIDFSSSPFTVINNVAGTNFPVTVSYNKVGTTTNNGIVSNLPISVKIVSIEYMSGNTSTTTYPTTGNVTNAMRVVAGIPNLSFVSGANISNKLVAKLKVASEGAVRITSIPLKFVTTGNSSSIATGTQITVRNSAGTEVATGTVAGTGTNGTSTVVFASQYDVTGEVLDVYADGLVLTDTTDVNKVKTFLGSQSLFGWVDVEGDLTAISGSTKLDTSRYNENTSTEVTD